LIVVDTSVAVKWIVREQHHEAALDVLELPIAKIAPDFLLAELAHVLFKKCKQGEVEWEQAMLGIDAVTKHISVFVPASELVSDAFGLEQELSHGAYDCFFLGLALTSGVLVTADEQFAKRCQAGGYGHYVQLVDASGAVVEAKLAVASLPRDLSAEVERLSPIIRATSEAVAESRPFGQFRLITNPRNNFVLDSPAYRRLRDALAALNPVSLQAYLAICWLGRGYYGAGHWKQLWNQAATIAGEGLDRHGPYLLAQASTLRTGLEKLHKTILTTPASE